MDDEWSEAVDDFRGELRGDVMLAKEVGFHNLRKVWNRTIDKKPLMIVRCKGVVDVVSTVKFARKHHLEMSIRGGGHNIAGNAIVEGGLVLDLSLMRSVMVDHNAKEARVEGGALWADVDRECHTMFKLAVPGGLISSTGVGGLTLGGGVGWLSRSFGLSCDNLLSVDIVDANGAFHTVSKASEPDLFWALQGGGGNFGVVTGFRFQLHEVQETVFSQTVFPIKRAKEVFKFYVDFAKRAPQNLASFCWLSKHGIIINSVCVSKEEDVAELLAPLFELGPTQGELTEIPYAKIQNKFDGGNKPGNYWWSRSCMFEDISEKLMGIILQAFESMPDGTNIEIMQLGGAISNRKPEDSAFFHRSAKFELHSISLWEGDQDVSKYSTWAHSLVESVEKFSVGSYVNINTRGSHPAKQYGGNYEKLQAIKAKYDPDNFFHFNHNIEAKANGVEDGNKHAQPT